MRLPDLIVLVVCLSLSPLVVAMVSPYYQILPKIELPSPPIPTNYPYDQNTNVVSVLGDFFFMVGVTLTYIPQVLSKLPLILSMLGMPPQVLTIAVTLSTLIFAMYVWYVISGRGTEHTQR